MIKVHTVFGASVGMSGCLPLEASRDFLGVAVFFSVLAGDVSGTLEEADTPAASEAPAEGEATVTAVEAVSFAVTGAGEVTAALD